MRNLTKCIGIFAVGTMMLSTFFVTSCNSEDDFDFGPDSQYSLAERKMTRAGETFPLDSLDTIYHFVATLTSYDGQHTYNANFSARLYRDEEGKPAASLIEYTKDYSYVCPAYYENDDNDDNNNSSNNGNNNIPPSIDGKLCSVSSVSLRKRLNGSSYVLDVSGQCTCGVNCYGTVEGLIFF